MHEAGPTELFDALLRACVCMKGLFAILWVEDFWHKGPLAAFRPRARPSRPSTYLHASKLVAPLFGLEKDTAIWCREALFIALSVSLLVGPLRLLSGR